MIILIILIIVLLLSFLFINKTLKKKETILEKVKLQENTIKNDGFALMLQQEDGTYKESESSSWPSNMVFNAELSGCIDINGNKIENSLSFDKVNNVVNVSVGKTAYCYVYFDMEKLLSEYLINNVSSDVLWNSPLEDDGYRFVGTDPDNYICFGTNDKSTCTGDTDKYMYRIIGIFEDNNGNKHTKLIKKEALNTAYAWNSSYTTDVDWNNSDLYKGLNGSYFLTNTLYSYMQDSTWANKISNWNYTMTNTITWENYYINNSPYGPNYTYETGKTIYLHELNRSGKSNQSCHYASSTSADCNVGKYNTLNTKISLMYVSDFALSLGNDALNYTSNSNSSTMKTGWMHLSNNDSSAPSTGEWTMSCRGKTTSLYYAMYINSDTCVSGNYTEENTAVRPVFYLESNVEYDGGKGTLDNPIMISSEEDNSAAATLINTVSSEELWNSPLEDDGYRFAGTDPDNYICFGTNDKSTCTGDTDKYMYRIIGIFNDKEGNKHLKLIKKEALNTESVWHSDSQTDTDWNESDLYKGINGSYFLTNTEYSYMQDTSWTNKIATWNYTMTNTKSHENYRNNSVYGIWYNDNTGKVIYLHETNRSGKSNEICYYSSNIADCNVGEWKTLSTKVSLMYVSDYALSLGEAALNYIPYNDYDTMKTGWMHISNSDTNSSSSFEWTMSRFDTFGPVSNYYVWNVISMGMTNSFQTSEASSARPVFFLESDVEFASNSGNGSITNPYMILN